MPKRLGATLAHAAIYLGQRISVDAALQAGFVLEVLPAGQDFESSVVERIAEGIAFAGPSDLRATTLRAYKALVRDADERRKLTQVCHSEFDLIRQRAESGETQAVQTHFSKDLPG